MKQAAAFDARSSRDDTFPFAHSHCQERFTRFRAIEKRALHDSDTHILLRTEFAAHG
jgi:hypothetical protein